MKVLSRKKSSDSKVVRKNNSYRLQRGSGMPDEDDKCSNQSYYLLTKADSPDGYSGIDMENWLFSTFESGLKKYEELKESRKAITYDEDINDDYMKYDSYFDRDDYFSLKLEKIQFTLADK